MKQLKRWLIANKIYAGLIILMAIFGYMDIAQLKTFHELNDPQAWALYNLHTGPAIWGLWLFIILIIGLIYYMFSKDKSETLGILAAGYILLATGLEDVFYFILNNQAMPTCMQWFNDVGHLVAKWSNLLGETCVSPFALVSFALLGIGVSYYVFNKLKVAKW